MVDSVRGALGYSRHNSGLMEVSDGDQVRSRTARAGLPLISIQVLPARRSPDRESGKCRDPLLVGSKFANIHVRNLTNPDLNNSSSVLGI
jgi:hypothetical protein